MYKCGWNGCEKAYGTLNHLNAHVTMQSHGVKRTPEGMLISFFMTCIRDRGELVLSQIAISGLAQVRALVELTLRRRAAVAWPQAWR